MNKVAILAVALLAGCVTTGRKIDPNAAAQFVPGVTTLPDVESALGPPTATGRHSDGTMSISYLYTHAAANGATYIPIVGPFVGHTNATATDVVINFDAKGKFVNYAVGESTVRAGLIH